MNCPICTSDKNITLFQLTSSNKVIACLDCTVQFLSPQLNDKELADLYSENYYKSWGIKGDEENEVIKQMKKATFNLRLHSILKFIKGGTILDVGCATGYFLELSKEKGFVPYGVEISEYSSKISINKFGRNNIFHGTLEDSNFPEKNFDVIAMSDLIEHVRNPIKTLTKAVSLLKDDGIIMIMTPNTKSVSNYLMKKRWTHYKLEHFFYFNKKNIEDIATQSGLELIYFEKSKKALTINYLHTQFNVYKHWLLTPIINLISAIMPKNILSHNFYFGIGEMVVILTKKK